MDIVHQQMWNLIYLMEIDESASALRKRVRFDAAGFYEAIKPSKYVSL